MVGSLFHEDGDMVDIFPEAPANDSAKVWIGDHGLTLMRLIYTCDPDTDTEQCAFSRSPGDNGIQEQDGRLLILNYELNRFGVKPYTRAFQGLLGGLRIHSRSRP